MVILSLANSEIYAQRIYALTQFLPYLPYELSFSSCSKEPHAAKFDTCDRLRTYSQFYHAIENLGRIAVPSVTRPPLLKISPIGMAYIMDTRSGEWANHRQYPVLILTPTPSQAPVDVWQSIHLELEIITGWNTRRPVRYWWYGRRTSCRVLWVEDNGIALENTEVA